MRLAYVVTQYPKVSHTFIRREILEIERRGHFVLRLAIRRVEETPVDPSDQAEQAKVLQCLAQPAGKLLLGAARTFITGPIAFVRALSLTIWMGWRSERGLPRHFAYLMEAAYLVQVLRSHSIEHLHAHFGTNATAVARLIRRLGGPTYSFTVHGTDLFDAPRSLDIRGKVADAMFVVAVCDFSAAQLRRWASFEDWSKIHIVRCTVGDQFFNEARPVDPDSNTLVCVGRLSPEKGQMLLIDALTELVHGGVDVHLVLVGDGELRSVLERRIAEAGLTDRVTLTGSLSEAEVRQQLLAARAVVLPSFAEGLPMVIMEAMALTRPVIGTYVAGIPELVRPDENGWLVPAGNTEQLAKAMRAALELPHERLSEMGRHGRDSILKRHNTRVETERLERLFREVVDRGQTGRQRRQRDGRS